MAESTVPSTSLSAGSETLYDIVCHPCSSEGKIAEAEGYCQDCCEHLCTQCISFHKKFSVSKHHTLVDKDNMPSQQDTLSVKDICTERCHIHKEEIVKFYCPTHKVLGCTVCITLKHKLCEDVAYIPELVTEIADSKDYKEFKTKLEILIQRSKDTVKFSQESKQRSSDCLSKVIQDIDEYKQEVIDLVEARANELKERARKIKEQDMDKMNILADANNQVMTELQSVSSDFNSLLNNNLHCQLFIEMKRKEENLTELDDKLQDVERTEVSEYAYEHDDDIRITLGREDGIGKLVIKKAVNRGPTTGSSQGGANTSKPGEAARDIQQIKATHVVDVDAKSASNSKTCHISGIALISTDKLVVADYENDTMKLIDIANNRILSELKPESVPWDVTVCGDKLAATLPNAKKVILMKYDKGLVHDRTIGVGGQCRGIDCCDDKLFVIFDTEKKLEIMTMTGNVLQKIETNEQGGQIFDDPTYVTVSKANKSIYVSEWSKGQLKILGMDGKLKGVYEDSELRHPRQLAVDKAGVMFLCDYGRDTVNLLSSRGTKVKNLLTKRYRKALRWHG